MITPHAFNARMFTKTPVSDFHPKVADIETPPGPQVLPSLRQDASGRLVER